METITMKTRFSLGLAAILVAGFFAALPSTASAQSFDVGVSVHTRNGSFGVYLGDDNYRGRRGPVYRGNDCRRDCGDYRGNGRYGRDRSYDRPMQREVITVYVDQRVSVWDRRRGCYVDRWVQVPVRAYWDYRNGGYFYTDSYGNYVRVR